MPALKFNNPLAEAEPAFPLPSPDFHGTRFHKPHCITQALARRARNDHDLVVRLGRMPIDLAAPLLRSSLPSLDTSALLALIATTGEAHHVLIAQRPGLDWRVVRALIRSGRDTVLMALVRNNAAELDGEDRERLERLALDLPELHGALLERFGRPRGRPDSGDQESHSNLKMITLLRKGAIDGFVAEAARRLRVPSDALNLGLKARSAVPLALAFTALGLDRAAFLHLLPFWQAAHDGRPFVTGSHRAVVLPVFALSRDDARRKLVAMLPAEPVGQKR
ncbi:MAG: DUF2336 domain-containing protein [Asticcacaulis sp.]|nr:DUF2336 domain-containing protein [Asticcacaulis sp.]